MSTCPTMWCQRFQKAKAARLLYSLCLVTQLLASGILNSFPSLCLSGPHWTLTGRERWTIPRGVRRRLMWSSCWLIVVVDFSKSLVFSYRLSYYVMVVIATFGSCECKKPRFQTRTVLIVQHSGSSLLVTFVCKMFKLFWSYGLIRMDMWYF